MGIAAVLATLFTLLIEWGPASVKKWVPSPTGLGLSFILPASNRFTFLLGAVIAEFVSKKWPKQHDFYTIASASGFIAGESIMGVVVALYTAMYH